MNSTNLKDKTKSKAHRKLVICSAGHQQQIRKNKAAFYKTENCPITDILVKTSNERDAGEFVLTMNICPQSFLRENHTFNVEFIKRIICNNYFNNAQKMSTSAVRRDTVQQFKHR